MIQLQIVKDVFGWGFLLWLFGYIASILLYFIFPPVTIGWLIMPAGAVLTWWVCSKKLYEYSITGYFFIGVAWTAIAVVMDYFFIVKLFAPQDGYYKLDVYIYYLLTFAIPFSTGLRANGAKA